MTEVLLTLVVVLLAASVLLWYGLWRQAQEGEKSPGGRSQPGSVATGKRRRTANASPAAAQHT